MIRLKHSFLVVLFAVASLSLLRAQPPTIDVVGAGLGVTGSVKYYDPAGAIGKKAGPALDYSEVRGKYMWDNEWSPGLMVMRAGNANKVHNVKLNIHTHEIHFLAKDGAEMIAAPGSITKLVLYSAKDTSTVRASFVNWRAAGATTDMFYEELNVGKVQLVKKAMANLKKLEYDPTKGKAEYRFYTTTDYFIKQGGAPVELKSLNKSSVESLLKLDDASEDWLRANKNKLKSEEETVAFLNYFNAR